ncbi:hypothetical protein MP213Fo_13450 [Pseudochrobactrum sp. MP213Fo]
MANADNKKGRPMAFEEIKAEIALLFEQMVNQPEDTHELAETIREKLNAMRASGLPVPDDLVELEERINSDLGV